MFVGMRRFIVSCVGPLVLTASIAQAQPAASPPPLISHGAINQVLANEIFLFGRANYFRILAKQRDCGSVDKALFESTNKRFEDAQLRLAAKYSDRVFPVDKPVTGIRDGSCDEASLSSYSSHMAELEQALQADK
jgi:hypothetical protein